MNRLELVISKFLRLGVLASGVLLLVGWLGMWWNGREIAQGFSEYRPQSFLESLHWGLVLQDKYLLLSLLGLVLLVVLPVIRVFMTGVLFAWQKEYKLSLMAFMVFFALVLSFTLGIDL